MNPKQGVKVNYSDFIKELTNEVNFMQVEATTYRRKTAELALFVAKKRSSLNFFLNRDAAYKAVSNVLPAEDVFRLEDVAKMLHVVLLDLHSEANRSDELEAHLNKRARLRKPLNLVPVK